ncbi:5-oxoprolinase subunit PxpA [Microbacterium sp. ARD32]|uniref:LamB/YcsF family protein n=1 Tax=Microbacterium sp. ARD32 TaxID=2962577 RepID=UPI0028828DD6|nr:5-oxoprolinase subunit PxpA [Microbacterium sp. ARD32]MDT0156055.1 5-oxoprolinase subunit PxpA [Microbacterium sp. ARD32]
MASIDLNSDLGENTPDRIVGDDAAMLEIVTSANVSCGFHAGSPEGIRSTVQAAARRGVVIGAHPGYRDHANFGRRNVEIDSATLQAHVEYQLGALIGLATAAGTTVAYVKPHGALYNTIARDERQAADVVAAVKAIDPSLVLLGLAGGVVLEVASKAGLQVAAEAFADRAYQPDGQLVPRSQEGAVLHDPTAVAERMVRFAETGMIRAIDGTDVRVEAQSICVHGDSAGAIAMAVETKRMLQQAGVTIAPFAVTAPFASPDSGA